MGTVGCPMYHHSMAIRPLSITFVEEMRSRPFTFYGLKLIVFSFFFIFILWKDICQLDLALAAVKKLLHVL
jgi:hypothetical protein